MFKKNKEREIDYSSLNNILKTGNKLVNIVFFMTLVAAILLSTYLIKEWGLLGFIKEFLVVISPIFIGFLIAWLFEPLVTTMQKKKIPRILGCIIVYLVIISVLFLIVYLFIPSLISEVKDFVKVAPDIYEELSSFVLNIIQRFDTNNFINVTSLKKELTNWISDYGMSIASDLPKYLLSVGKVIISGGINFVLGLMVGFYLLYDFHKVNEFIFNMLPENIKYGYKDLTNRINTSLRSYVQGVLLVKVLVFITQSIGLTIAGLEAPILFALFCAVTDIIPYFGPYIGGIPAVIVGFTMSPITGICVLISIVIVQLLENNFYQPLIMGHTMKLHPVTIMIGLLIFEHFFGILGMVVATPVIACLKVFILFLDEKYNLRGKIIGENEQEKIKKQSKTK